MSKFKPGDRVRIDNDWDFFPDGTVSQIQGDLLVIIHDDGNIFWHEADTCEVIHEDPKNQVIDQMNADRENFVVLQPGEVWTPGGVDNVKTCTCGMTAIGGGLHSDWCDLYEGETNE